ncbi:putative transposase, Ptta/En/Spm, plant [Helianthus annuus]|uniref:Transposase, Ptta/En/Spm, plant n=1 Tax=Helianthus annuus TaxID=4232 RepID=A0A251TM34_HELAN|nr:putative transposase, Ptta/En/Spm, plant [Helianthus annuus]
MTIGSAYKRHKCRFKKKPFYQYKDNKTRWKNKPKNIKDEDFSKLMTLWNNKDEAKRCLRAKEARMSQKNMHIAGPKSFARIRNEMAICLFLLVTCVFHSHLSLFMLS